MDTTPVGCDEVNQAFSGILRHEERPLVSRDFTGEAHSCILDVAQTQVGGGDLLEAQGWHDAEWGFSSRMVDLVGIIASDD